MKRDDVCANPVLLEFDEIDLTLKMLYQLYCFEPNEQVISLLQESELLSLWQTLTENHQENIQAFFAQDDAMDALKADHLALLIGIGMPLSPPWGSVYISEENLLLQSSTYQWMDFLKEQNLQFVLEENQPQDNIGLMLSAVAVLYERYTQAKTHNGDIEMTARALRVALSDHVSPWAQRFCQLLSENADTPLYRLVADITSAIIDRLMSEVQAKSVVRDLYY